jgi:hypothetical protein
MADVIRNVEIWELVGTRTRADLGKKYKRYGAYLDTGAGRTIITRRVADSICMIDVPHKIEYSVPLRVTVQGRLTAMRLCVGGCGKPVPLVVAVSDQLIERLELPGVEILIGQDYMQAARLVLEMAPGKAERVTCRRSRSRLR